MSSTPTAGAQLKDTLFKIGTGAHKAIFRASNGRLLGKAMKMPVLILVTTGAKSGKKRENMLTSPVQRGEEIVLVASYGGDPRHPAWYHNLRANPEVEVIMRGSRQTMTARVASPQEKAELWDEIVSSYRGYAGYQKRTDRDIPVVVLSPSSR